MEEFSIRDGRLSDCATIARLVNESSGGAADYLFDKADLEGKTAELKVSQLLASEVHYSYANTIVVQIKDEVIGIALSFPASGLLQNEEMKQYYSEQQFQYIQFFVENKLKDSWHLDAICVESKYRANGVGKQLLDKVKQQAEYYRFPMLEVFVFASNENAIRFYQSNNFVIQESIDVAQHEFLGNKGPLLLMSCDLPDKRLKDI